MAKKGAAGKTVKKKWVKIFAPKVFDEQVIGESLVADPKSLVGRKVSVSLMSLTGEPQKQSVHVMFTINGAKEEGVTTEMVAYRISPSVTKKFVRRKRDKVSDSFIVEMKDKNFVQVKPLIVTRGRTSRSVLSAMRMLARAILAKSVSGMVFDDIVRDVAQKKLQNSVAQQLKKLHPVGICEIRQLVFVPAQRVKEQGLKVTLPPKSLAGFEEKKEAKQEA